MRVIALVSQGLCDLKDLVVSKEGAHRPFLLARIGEEREEKVALTGVKHQKMDLDYYTFLLFKLN